MILSPGYQEYCDEVYRLFASLGRAMTRAKQANFVNLEQKSNPTHYPPVFLVDKPGLARVKCLASLTNPTRAVNCRSSLAEQIRLASFTQGQI